MPARADAAKATAVKDSTTAPATDDAAVQPAAPPDSGASVAADPAPGSPAVDVAVYEAGPRVSTCVVNEGRGRHVGNAVNGKVCSYHAMHYDAAGNRR